MCKSTEQRNSVEDIRESVFFVGVGGSGMNVLAKWLCYLGYNVSGSDREYDRGLRKTYYNSLESDGIKLFPQNGSGVSNDLSRLITSTAVEAQIPDLVAANRLGVPVVHRSEELSLQVSKFKSIAIAGTSGKSTVTGMVGWILNHAGLEPTVVNGAPLQKTDTSSISFDFKGGSGDWVVFEADESDGSLTRFNPDFGLVNNITKDHYPIEKLRKLFREFANNTKRELIINGDCPETLKLKTQHPKIITFGFNGNSDFAAQKIDSTSWGNRVLIENKIIDLHLPGHHNMQNALAAYVLVRRLGVSPEKVIEALSCFPGISRRFECIGTVRDITVIDDYAHNPDKIKSAIETAKSMSQRVILIYQPHGFGPTKFFFQDLINVFSKSTRADDMSIILPIFYAGGSVSKDISSNDLCAEINRGGGTSCVQEREHAPEFIKSTARPGDVILLMGARDPSLAQFSRSIFGSLAD